MLRAGLSEESVSHRYFIGDWDQALRNRSGRLDPNTPNDFYLKKDSPVVGSGVNLSKNIVACEDLDGTHHA
jgi:hypothetical protein